MEELRALAMTEESDVARLQQETRLLQQTVHTVSGERDAHAAARARAESELKVS